MTSIVVAPIFAGYWIASPYISPARDRGARFGRRIVADDRDLAGQSGGFYRGERAERGIVVDPENALEIAVRLEDVAGIAARLVARYRPSRRRRRSSRRGNAARSLALKPLTRS